MLAARVAVKDAQMVRARVGERSKERSVGMSRGRRAREKGRFSGSRGRRGCVRRAAREGRRISRGGGMVAIAGAVVVVSLREACKRSRESAGAPFVRPSVPLNASTTSPYLTSHYTTFPCNLLP